MHALLLRHNRLLSPTLIRFNPSSKFSSLSATMSSSIVLPSISLTKSAFGASESFKSSSCLGFKNEIRRVSGWKLEKSRVVMSVAVGSETIVGDDALFKDYNPSTAFLFPGQGAQTVGMGLEAQKYFVMEVKTARNASSLLNVRPAKKQVCRFWLQGRCNRNPCRFMHTELPPPPHPKRSMTWKNPNSHPVSKKGHVDPLEKALTDSRKSSVTEQVSKKGHVDPLEKALADSRKSNLTEQVSKKGHVDPLEKALANSRKRSLTEQVSKNKKLDHVDQSTLEKSSQPLQCKYWVTGNCVHGDKCKYLQC